LHPVPNPRSTVSEEHPLGRPISSHPDQLGGQQLKQAVSVSQGPAVSQQASALLAPPVVQFIDDEELRLPPFGVEAAMPGFSRPALPALFSDPQPTPIYEDGQALALGNPVLGAESLPLLYAPVAEVKGAFRHRKGDTPDDLDVEVQASGCQDRLRVLHCAGGDQSRDLAGQGRRDAVEDPQVVQDRIEAVASLPPGLRGGPGLEAAAVALVRLLPRPALQEIRRRHFDLGPAEQGYPNRLRRPLQTSRGRRRKRQGPGIHFRVLVRGVDDGRHHRVATEPGQKRIQFALQVEEGDRFAQIQVLQEFQDHRRRPLPSLPSQAKRPGSAVLAIADLRGLGCNPHARERRADQPVSRIHGKKPPAFGRKAVGCNTGGFSISRENLASRIRTMLSAYAPRKP